MFYLLRTIILLGIAMITFISTSGCMQMLNAGGVEIHDSAIKKFPTFSETKAAWRIIPDGNGRVVVFYPRVSPMSAAEKIFVGVSPIGVKIDKTRGPVMSDQLFFFVDLPAGEHSLKNRSGAIFGSPTKFNVLPGEIIYIKVGLKGGDFVTVMKSQEAEPLVLTTYHLFRLPLPYDKQPKSAEKFKW